ncbi:hypothetical protein NMG60_11004995 [Bertholletia excelsa]
MEVGSCCISGNQRAGWSRSFSEGEEDSPVMTGPKVPMWRLLWRRIKKEKKRIFDCSTSVTVQFTYDPYTYAQNFDDGAPWKDPEDLSRSFSARFAVPSRIFENVEYHRQ